jgi:hypothetical protein
VNEPWIGDENTEPGGVCAYGGIDPGHPHCGDGATVHILSESAIHGPVGLPTCDRHAPIARGAGLYLGEHAYGPACRAPITFWQVDGCNLEETA